MPLELALLRAGGRVPKPDEFVPPARRERAAIGRKCHRGHRAGMGRDRLHFAAVGRVPNDHGAVLAGRGQLRAIGREIECTHPALVLFEVAFERAGRVVPEFREAVIACGGGQFSILGNPHGPDGRWMTGQIAHPRAIRLPHDDITRPIEQALATSGRERRAIAGVVGGDHPATEAAKIFSGGRWLGCRRRIGREHGQGEGEPAREKGCRHGPQAGIGASHRGFLRGSRVKNKHLKNGTTAAALGQWLRP